MKPATAALLRTAPELLWAVLLSIVAADIADHTGSLFSATPMIWLLPFVIAGIILFYVKRRVSLALYVSATVFFVVTALILVASNTDWTRLAVVVLGLAFCATYTAISTRANTKRPK